MEHFRDFQDTPGIYAIRTPSVTYVGKSMAVRTRLIEHLARLERNVFGYDQLQADWLRQRSACRFEVLEYVTDAKLLSEREKFHMQNMALHVVVVGDRKNSRKVDAAAKPGEYGVPGKRATVSRQIWDLCNSLPQPPSAEQVVAIALERGITKSPGNARAEYGSWRRHNARQVTSD